MNPKEIEKFNMRICYIDRIFQYELFVGVTQKQLLQNPYHYNDRFNKLYDMDLYALETLEQEIHELTHLYLNHLNLK